MSNLPVLGVIGCGNMGSAVLMGLSAMANPLFKLAACDRNEECLRSMTGMGVSVTANLMELVNASDWLVFAVKPDQVLPLLDSLSGKITNKVIISLAAGVSLAALRKVCRDKGPTFRVMSNTAATVGRGIFAICQEDPKISDDQKATAYKLFSSLGQAVIMPEIKFNAFTAVAGCGPAYVFHHMEALIEASVSLGLTREESTKMVIALFRGSATLAKQSGKHISVLREEVCSPAGMSIAAMNKLDMEGVRGKIIAAVFAAYSKGVEMEEISSKQRPDV